MAKATTSRWHLPSLVRGLALLGAVAATCSVMTKLDGTILPLGWGLFIAFAIVYLVGGLRVLALDARAPGGDTVFVFHTRVLPPFAEVIIAGMGGLFLFFAAVTIIDLGVAQVGTKTPLAGVVLFAFGVPMTLWRPTFVLDAEHRTLRRCAFGRALPLRTRALPYRITIGSEGYYSRAGTAGQRIGDMIRGRTAAGTFELEFVPGNDAEATGARVAYWQRVFDALA